MYRLSNSLFNPKKAKRHPLEMFFVGFFYTSLSALLSIWIFPEYASITSIFLTVLSSLYIVQGAIINEQKKESIYISEKKILKRHSKIILLLLYLFLGFLLAFFFWKMVLPENHADILYKMQESELDSIKSITGNATSISNFKIIIANNLRVLFISILFAIFYGAGVLFILAWNASIMGFVIAALIKDKFGFEALPLIFTKYYIHGIPEMISYFIGALAGGIIFVTIAKGDFKKEKVKRIALDTAILLVISLAILIIAALIESYISPLI